MECDQDEDDGGELSDEDIAGQGSRAFKKTMLLSQAHPGDSAHQNGASGTEQDTKAYPRARIPETSNKSYRVMPRNDIHEIEQNQTSFQGMQQRKSVIKKLNELRSAVTAAK